MRRSRSARSALMGAVFLLSACLESDPSKNDWQAGQNLTFKEMIGRRVITKEKRVFGTGYRPEIGKKQGDVYYCLTLSDSLTDGQHQYCGVHGNLYAAVREGSVVSADQDPKLFDPSQIRGRVIDKVVGFVEFDAFGRVPVFFLIVDSIAEIKAYPVDATMFYWNIEKGTRLPLDRPSSDFQPEPSAVSNTVLGIYEFAALRGRVIDSFVDPASSSARGYVAIENAGRVTVHAVDLMTYYHYVERGLQLPFSPPPLIPQALIPQGDTTPPLSGQPPAGGEASAVKVRVSPVQWE